VALLELIFDAANWAELAKAWTEASWARRLILVLEILLGGFLVYGLFGQWNEWAFVVLLVVMTLLGVLAKRFFPREQERPEEDTKRRPSPEEIRVRAAAERAEREIAHRGSHPLGHPGSGGRLSD
jgi:uncharacterized membrane protein YfcA